MQAMLDLLDKSFMGVAGFVPQLSKIAASKKQLTQGNPGDILFSR